MFATAWLMIKGGLRDIEKAAAEATSKIDVQSEFFIAVFEQHQ